MSRISAAFITLLLVVAALTLASAEDRPWRMSGQHYSIASVYGYQKVYSPGEEISIYVEGHSPDQIEAEPAAGFNVEASMTNDAINKTIANARSEYDESKRAWLVKFKAPSDFNSEYHVHVYFGCFTEGAPCEYVYGRNSRAVKSMPLQLH